MKTFFTCLLTFFLHLVVLHVPAYGQSKLDISKLQVVFRDDFNYTSVDGDPVPNNNLHSRWYTTMYKPFDIYNGRAEYDDSQISFGTFPSNGGNPEKFLRLSLTRTPKHCRNNASTCDTVADPNSILSSIMYKTGIICSKESFRMKYGLLEMRVRIPGVPINSGLWLSGQPGTEIDLMEGDNGLYGIFSPGARNFTTNVHYWPLPSGHDYCETNYQRNSLDAFSDNFHTYSVYWTPTKITFFFDNRELRTVSYDAYARAHGSPCNQDLSYIIANLGIGTPYSPNYWILKYFQDHPTAQAFMDIDYIQVSKPINDDYTLPYKFPYAWMHHNLPVQADGSPGAMTANSNNGGEVFYKSGYGSLYRVYRPTTQAVWVSERINYTFGQVPVPRNSTADYMQGPITYNPADNSIVYVGSDTRLQFFKKNPTVGWTHGWVDISTSSASSADIGTNASVAVTSNGTIFYKGDDSKLHRFYKNISGVWTHEIVGGSYYQPDLVQGDIVVGTTGDVYYKAVNNFLQAFYPDGNGGYFHVYINTNWANQSSADYVSTVPNSITLKTGTWGSTIYFLAQDGQIYEFSWNSTLGWHRTPTKTLTGGGLARAGLKYDPINQRLVYGGVDGRVNFLANNGNGTWEHWWIDDYFNTTDYQTNSGTPTPHNNEPNICLPDDKTVFYTLGYQTGNSNVAYFAYEPGEVLDPSCTTVASPNQVYSHVNRSATTVSGTASSTTLNQKELVLYPNPSTSQIRLRGEVLDAVSTGNYFITDVVGRVVQRGVVSIKNSVDISRVPDGIYIFTLLTGKNAYKARLIKGAVTN